MSQYVLSSLSAAGLSLGAPAWAHHSTALFDMNTEITLTGTVKQFQWMNPHTWIVLEVPNADGGVDEYGIEGMSPSNLARNGWSKHSLNAGDKVVLTIHPLKDGRKGGIDVSVQLPNGQRLYNLPHRS